MKILDGYFAKIIDKVHVTKPKAIGFDVFFTERDKQSPDEFLKAYNLIPTDVSKIQNLKAEPSEEEVQKQMLGSFCPNILYPYIRSILTSMVMEGGFPNLYLAPVNFDALYMQQKEKLAQESNTAATSDAIN